MRFATRDTFKPINTIARALALISKDPMGALQRARADFPDDYELQETIETRAAVVPTSAATVTQFSATAVSDLGGVIGPLSAFSQITSRALGVNLDVPQSSVLVPHAIAAADSVSFIAPGSPIPVKNFTLASATLSPHKAAAIVALTREAAEHTNAEQMIRALLSENVGLSIDKLLLDANDTDGIRPAGLRYNVSADTTNGTMAEDLADLAASVAGVAGNLSNIVYVASPDLAVRIAIALPNNSIPVIATGGLAAGTIMAIAVNALAVAASPTIRIDVSDETTLHMEDTSPAALSTVATPNTVAAPIRSLFQTDAKALKLVFETDWKWRTTPSNCIAWMTSITW